jgi:hypothetical protein
MALSISRHGRELEKRHHAGESLFCAYDYDGDWGKRVRGWRSDGATASCLEVLKELVQDLRAHLPLVSNGHYDTRHQQVQLTWTARPSGTTIFAILVKETAEIEWAFRKQIRDAKTYTGNGDDWIRHAPYIAKLVRKGKF